LARPFLTNLGSLPFPPFAALSTLLA